MSVKRNTVLLNTEAHRPARDQFVEHLNSAMSREGWRPYEAIGYWLEAAFRSFRGRFVFGEAFEKNEAEYMRIVKRCRHPAESMADLSSMLGALVLALESAPVDFIGPIYGEYAASSSLGQFFTPYHVSRLMAEMIIGERGVELAKTETGIITLQEPACGVGGMVLAAAEVLRERGFDLARDTHWLMVDVDFSATCAAYLQACLCGLSADVIHGNTISLQTWLSTPTLAAVMHPKRLSKPSQPSFPDTPPEPSVTVAQRQADAPLRPRKPQAPLDFGLFGDARDQLDLVDLSRRTK